jgi:multicomponent Na+:H+ antiporter subunit B
MELHLILIFMIIAAIVAVLMKDLISSLIALSSAGLGLSLAFLILKAPNLAITQLVVEILVIIILIRATIRRDLPLVIDGRWVFNTSATLLFIACFLAFGYLALRELPNFGEPVMKVSAEYLASGFEKTGASNIVTAITLNFRNYDALGEAAVLFAAVIGLLAITRKTGRVRHEK